MVKPLRFVCNFTNDVFGDDDINHRIRAALGIRCKIFPTEVSSLSNRWRKPTRINSFRFSLCDAGSILQIYIIFNMEASCSHGDESFGFSARYYLAVRAEELSVAIMNKG